MVWVISWVVGACVGWLDHSAIVFACAQGDRVGVA